MKWRAVVRSALVVLGGVLAALSLVVGYLNRELLDGPAFAEHVEQIRRDDQVVELVGQAISTRLIVANPDLVALRPLIQSVATSVASGDVLAGPVRVAAREAHRAFTHDGRSIVLRITDVGAVVTAALAAVAPERVPAATADVSVTLASIDDRAFASTVISVVAAADLLAWLLPVAAVVCFAVALILSPTRWATAAAIGRSLAWSAAAVGAVLLVGGVVVARIDDDTITGAVVRAAWREIVRPMWLRVAMLAVVGLATALVCGSRQPISLADRVARLREFALQRPQRASTAVARSAGAVLLGGAAILDPAGVTSGMITLAGAVLVLVGINEALAAVSAAWSQRTARTSAAGNESSGRTLPRPVVLTFLGAVTLAVAAGVFLQARPGDDVVAADVGAGTGTVCNGYAELCDRRFDEVAYVATHNAMSVVRAPGWFLGEQLDPIPDQLDQGVRALLIDVWSGVPADTLVRTAPGRYDVALAQAEAELGPEVVAAALRLSDSIVGEASGTEARYLCHGLCETGSTSLLETLGQLRGWLATHPDEVVTLIIEDHVDAELIAADIEAAGLLPVVYTPIEGEPWPTLGEMIRSGRRLVVMVENGTGDAQAPWLLNVFEHVQDTPYTFPTVDSFSCDHNRGPADAPLFLLNHWLSGFSSLVTDARLVNERELLLARAEQCAAERGQLPNFVAVNFVVIGDTNEVVAILNGVA